MSPTPAVTSPSVPSLSTGGDRWLAAGRSGDLDGRRAGAEAARGALAGDHPRLRIVFCWGGYDLPEPLEGLADESGDVPLVGGSTAVVLAAA